jgi:hypothetical protein
MQITIDTLSKLELDLYNYAESLDGDMDSRNKQLQEEGIFDQYKNLHQSYLDLFFDTKDEEIQLEILKRLIFLNWYSLVEPSCYTGIQDLDNRVVFESYSILNEYLIDNKIDKEFIWMLSYYSSWDFAILPFSENNLNALTRFVKEVDTALSCPQKQLPKGSMDNRGQMGIYWKIRLVEKDE